MLLLPTALVFVFGQLLGKKRESRPGALRRIPALHHRPRNRVHPHGASSGIWDRDQDWRLHVVLLDSGDDRGDHGVGQLLARRDAPPCHPRGLHGDADPVDAGREGRGPGLHGHVHHHHGLHSRADVRQDARVPGHQDNRTRREARPDRLPDPSDHHTLVPTILAYASGAAAAIGLTGNSLGFHPGALGVHLGSREQRLGLPRAPRPTPCSSTSRRP